MRDNQPSPTQQALELAVIATLVARGKLTPGGMDRALRACEAGDEAFRTR